MTDSFSVSFDYLCPFARNAHEHLLAGLDAGAGWDVTFTPFSLGQAHVPEGEDPVWQREDKRHYLWALAAGVVVRDRYAERFFEVHRALFAARHDDGNDIRNESVVRDVLEAQGLDPGEVMSHLDDGIAEVQRAHTEAVESLGMFGVPTFVKDGKAVFVRLMDRPGDDPKNGIRAVEGVLRLLDDFPTLNEYKFTRIPR